MPLPSDQRIVDLSEKLVDAFDNVFGKHPGYRAAHARGVLLAGSFTPTPAAGQLSSAPHFSAASTPVTVRFSSSTGLPKIPDTDPHAEPRGFGLRFNLAPHKHTDIIAHSTNAFPVRTGEEFLAFFNALLASNAGGPPIADYVGAHPSIAAFLTAPKPAPESFGTEAYFGLNAYKFTSAAGESRFGRYTIRPQAGLAHLSDEARDGRGPNYLFDEIQERVRNAPVGFDIWVQLANEGDPTDDVTKQWPADREQVLLGTVTLDEVVPENVKEQKQIIFDPIPRVNGIEPSDDPLFELRAAVYLISGRRRRAEPVPQD